MASTTFVDGDLSLANRIVAAWLNDVNDVAYDILGNGTLVPTTKAIARDNLNIPGYHDLKEYGVNYDGTNEYAAIMNAHDTAPAGSVIYITGKARFTTPLVFTRNLSWVCIGEQGYFNPAVTGGSQQAIWIKGALMRQLLYINMYSDDASNGIDGIKFDNVLYSRIRSRVQGRGSGYAFRVTGCLVNEQFDLTSSTNFDTPFGTPYLYAKHMLMESGGWSVTSGCNRNTFQVLFEGGGDGVTISAHNSQGNSTFTGTIEGLTGRPFVVTETLGLSLREIHLETNSSPGTFTQCIATRVESVLGGAPAQDILSFIGCTGTTVENSTCSLTIDSDCGVTVLDNCVSNGGTITNASATTITRQGTQEIGQTNHLSDAAGMPPMENLFQNPFLDIWPTGVSGTPLGFESSTNATFARETGTVYAGNPKATAIAVTATGTAIGQGVIAIVAAPYAALAVGRWVAPLVAVYVATGQPNLRVYLFDGTSYILMETVTTKDAWVEVRGPSFVPASASWGVAFRPNNGSFVAGNYFIGGCSIVNGVISPRYLFDSGRRQDFIKRQIKTDNGDAAATVTVGISPEIQIWATALTADRQATLSTTGAVKGDRFDIKRSATGAFNLNVHDSGAGLLKALPATSWGQFVFNGTAWELLAYGSL